MVTLNIPMTDELRRIVEERMAAARDATPADYVLRLIRRNHEQAAQDRLEALLLEGLDSGPPIEMTDAYLDGLRERMRAQVIPAATGGKR